MLGFAFGVQVYGIFWVITSGLVSVCSTPWFDSGYMLGVSLRGLLSSTLQKTAESPQLQFLDGRRHSIRYVEADSHGPALDHRDFAVAVRAGWSISLVCSREIQFHSCSSSMWSSSPLSLRTVYPMVLTIRQTWDSPVASHGGRRPCCAVLQYSSANVEETVELPQLQLVFLRGHCRALSRRCATTVLSGSDVTVVVTSPD